MSTPINLNKVRKARARAEKRARADTNSVTFGRRKSEKRTAHAENLRAAKKLDGKAMTTRSDAKDNGSEDPQS